MKYRINANDIDAYLYAIECYLWKRHTINDTDRILSPLMWYIRTGRASTQYLHKLMSVKPFVIGRILEKEGSYDEALARVESRIS